jgi:hypothetical protein
MAQSSRRLRESDARTQLALLLLAFAVPLLVTKLVASWGTAVSFGGFGFMAALLFVLLVMDGRQTTETDRSTGVSKH